MKFQTLILVLLTIVGSENCFADLPVNDVKCNIAKRMIDAGFLSENHVLGDCYYYGVTFDKNFEKSKLLFMISANNGSSYGAIRLGMILLFEEKDALQKNFGFYVLNNLSKSNDKSYSHLASYYLGAYFYYKNNELALEYLTKSYRGGSKDALIAIKNLVILSKINLKDLDDDILENVKSVSDADVKSWIERDSNRFINFIR